MESLQDRWGRLPGIEHLPAVGAAALTFDDGPDPDGTPAILDALDTAGLRATFFVLGDQLVRHHAIAREVVARGHELGLHGFEHADHAELTPDEAREEMARAVWALEAILDQRPRWFRPPFGRVEQASVDACREHGLELVYWSASGNDWLPVGAEQIVAKVLERLTDGSIVLLHDSVRFAERPNVAPTAAALPLLAEAAAERGIELRPLSEVTA
jgi:peptidoglycan-N-acetylglucosamine deacetylase